MILVTGGTGFVGSYLIRLLVQHGYHVRALRRVDSAMHLVHDVADRVEWVEADVTDLVALEEAFEGVTQVCHCAAMVSFHPRDVRRMMQVNVDGTANIVNLCLHFGVRKLVHVSSIAAIGRSKERKPLDEKSPWVQSKVTSQYAISKYQGEQEAWRGHAEGLDVAIVNPAIILGSGYWNVGSGRFFQQVNDGLKFWPVGRSGFVDVRDVAQFMLLLLGNNISGERYILNAGNISYREFFQHVARSIDARPPAIKVTPLLAEVAWRVEWVKEKLLGATPVVTRDSARSSVSQFFYGNEKSLSVPGFTYRPLETTIRETGAQFLESVREGSAWKVLPL
ncbi:MAG TPA: SDR family NAD(P)-dependent oxidoreductase [Saprospiraceae bacterium]|nr:SDR family NAD(P)-dependent oxidoreductase [Saprospiraceae bacterium]